MSATWWHVTLPTSHCDDNHLDDHRCCSHLWSSKRSCMSSSDAATSFFPLPRHQLAHFYQHPACFQQHPARFQHPLPRFWHFSAHFRHHPARFDVTQPIYVWFVRPSTWRLPITIKCATTFVSTPDPPMALRTVKQRLSGPWCTNDALHRTALALMTTAAGVRKHLWSAASKCATSSLTQNCSTLGLTTAMHYIILQ